MGRHRRECPTGRLRLKCYKNSDANKEYTLNYEYTWLDASPIRKDTGIKVKPYDWNPKGNNGRGELRTSYGNETKRLNALLNDTLQKYDARLRVYSEQHPNQMSSEVIHSILFDEDLTRQDEAQDFVEYVKKILESKRTRGKIGKSRYENGVSNMKGFTEFLASQHKGTYQTNAIYLGDINSGLVDEYITYRRDIKGNTDATINHALTPIIIACEHAKDEGYIDTKVYAAIKDCRVEEKPSLEGERFDGKYLSKEELTKLVDFYNTDTEKRRKEYIEMFLFAFHAGGLRLVDVMSLKWEHVSIEKKELRKIQVKTAKGRKPRHIIPLNAAAISILKRWQEIARQQRRTKFVFDLLPEDFNLDDADKLYYARNNADKKVNQALSVVGTKIGLKFTLAFHAARHSFAMNALNDGLSLSVVSRFLGHASTDITELIYAEYLPKKLADELESLHYDYVPNFED